MKKFLLFSIPLTLFALAPHVFAEGFVPLAAIPGLTEHTAATTSGLANFLNNLYKYLIGIAAVLTVIEIIWGGLEISTKDSVSSHQDGKNRIQQAILGLVLVLSPVLVFSIINPAILNLSLSLPPILKLEGKGIDFSSGGTQRGATTTAPVQAIEECSQTLGPVPGSLHILCTASKQGDATDAAEEYRSANCVGGVGGVLYGTKECIKEDWVGTGSAAKYECVEYKTESFCSPIVTISVVEKFVPVYGSPTAVYETVGYFDTDFKHSCETMSGWSIRDRAGTVSTSFECPDPRTNPSYGDLKKKYGGLIRCAKKEVYCGYDP
jgi:hypothetical protein